jgi:hypothetical protein
MTRGDEDRVRNGNGGDELVCPVCLRVVGGDEDVRESHVDACLAFASERLAGEEASRGARRMSSVGSQEPIERVTDETSLRGE